MTLRVDNIRQRHRKDFELGGCGFVFSKSGVVISSLVTPPPTQCKRVMYKNQMLLHDYNISDLTICNEKA